MKRTIVAVLAASLALIGLGLIACNQNSLEPRGTPSPAGAGEISPALDYDVSAFVAGSGHLIDDASDRTVVFNILKHADGSVEGWYHALVRGRGGANIRVLVDCLHISGNKAWAGGTIVDAVDPANIGRPWSNYFIDNGEGTSASPDEIGGLWADYDCATEPAFTTRQLTIGNLIIRERTY